jgi:hypothetical protein
MALTIALAALSYNAFSGGSDRGRDAALERAGRAIPGEFSPLRLEASESGGRIRLRATLRDLEGGEICVLERGLAGSSLAIDCWLVRAGPAAGAPAPHYVVFPRAIYSDAVPLSSGAALLESYDRGGFPALYDGAPAGASPLADDERKALSWVFRALEKGGTGQGLPRDIASITTRCTILIPVPGATAAWDIAFRSSGEAVLKAAAAEKAAPAQ